MVHHQVSILSLQKKQTEVPSGCAAGATAAAEAWIFGGTARLLAAGAAGAAGVGAAGAAGAAWSTLTTFAWCGVEVGGLNPYAKF